MRFTKQMAFNLNALLDREKWALAVEVAADAFAERNKIERTNLGFCKIRDAHRRRVRGEGSPAECDQACKEVADSVGG